ncbi:MAG: LuxR C-terminal-related transcriptional regulator [Muribaculaceae bacterium]|nr:LuxR C-terminal-related transcriptional regulator [Muribaculaceae bacterium]
MDILRKELNSIYESQNLGREKLDIQDIEKCRSLAEGFVIMSKGCAVITDASSDCSYLYIGALGQLLGIVKDSPCAEVYNSSDEDMIYLKIHPEDLVEKRMLEYEFFKYINSLSGKEKTNFQATCRLRMLTGGSDFIIVNNTTQIICPSPLGKIWLILCTYQLGSPLTPFNDISPAIKNNLTGEVIPLSFREKRSLILTRREKEIMKLIKEGKVSKQIADMLGISVHTVNRHRQNIIEKLSVGNLIEAITAAESMGLL